MGAMTMTHGDDAVDWVLKSLVNMFPRIQSVAKTTMSDLGEHTSMVKPSFPQVSNIHPIMKALVVI
jgi:hypothetical protein